MQIKNSIMMAVALVMAHGPGSAQAAPPASPQGTITARYFFDIAGGAVADLTNNVKFPSAPDLVRYEPYFEAWATGDIETPPANDVRNSYGSQLVGYFYPPVTGPYVFYLSADDNAALYLSTDDNPANKKLIAAETVWSDPREYSSSAGGSVAASKRSDLFAGTEWPAKNNITLEAGKAYYIEALHKEAGGGDNLSVSIDGVLPIPDSMLSPFAVAGAPTILSQPRDAAVMSGGTARFSVGLDLPPGVTLTSIQWQKNGVALTNSDTPDLAIPAVSADNGAKFKAVVTTSAGTLTSADAALTVSRLTSDYTPGIVKFEVYNDISGTSVDQLTSNPKYIDGTPDDIRLLGAIASPLNYGESYGASISGFIIPPTSGQYRFFLRSDDASQLWLSADEKPANAVLVAEENTCCNPFTEPESLRTTDPVTMIAGKKYAFFALLKEGGGDDFVQVAARKEGDTTPAASLLPLSGAWIGANAKPSLGDPQIVQQPQSLPQLVEGRSGVLSVQGTVTPAAYEFPVMVQWQKNGTNIPGATSSSYVIRNASSTNNGPYRAVLTAPNGKTVTSAEATVTVVPDTFGPEVLKAGSVLRNNKVEIGLGFDEPLDEPSASAPANYSLSKGAVTAVRFQKFDTALDAGATVSTSSGVVLETSGLTAGDSVTVTVMNVKDQKGNPMTAAGVSKTLTVTSKMSWTAVGGNDYQDGATPAGFDQTAANFIDDVVALGNDTDFEIISGGSANWDNYDETTFVHEQVTGDFDRVARVEYQDPGSHYARAGLMARKALDEGVTRAQVTAGAKMSQNIIIRANPAVQYNGAPGNNTYEWVWRDTDGGNYTSSEGGGVPAYPNAWLRLKRAGQTFTGYRSTDGIAWVNIGTHTFPASTPLPDTIYVGPYFAPELNNDSAWKIGHSVVAKFRQYGPFQPGGDGGSTTLSFAQGAGGKLTLNFSGGRLQVATKLGSGADWKDAPATGNSFDVNTSGGASQFFRVISP